MTDENTEHVDSDAVRDLTPDEAVTPLSVAELRRRIIGLDSRDEPLTALEVMELASLRERLATAERDAALVGEAEPAADDVEAKVTMTDDAPDDKLLAANGFAHIRGAVHTALGQLEGIPVEALDATVNYAKSAGRKARLGGAPAAQLDAIDGDVAVLELAAHTRRKLNAIAERKAARSVLTGGRVNGAGG